MEFLTVWSLRFDARELDHYAPLLDFIADEFGKLAGRVRRRLSVPKTPSTGLARQQGQRA